MLELENDYNLKPNRVSILYRTNILLSFTLYIRDQLVTCI